MQTSGGIPTTLCNNCVKPVTNSNFSNYRLNESLCQCNDATNRLSLHEAIERANRARGTPVAQTSLGVEVELCWECMRPRNSTGFTNPTLATSCKCKQSPHHKTPTLVHPTNNQQCDNFLWCDGNGLPTLSCAKCHCQFHSQCVTPREANRTHNGVFTCARCEPEAKQNISDLLSGNELQPTRCQQAVCYGTGMDVWKCEACGYQAHQRCVPRNEWPTPTDTGFRCHECIRRACERTGPIATFTQHDQPQVPRTEPSIRYSGQLCAPRQGYTGSAEELYKTPSKFQSLPNFAGDATENPQAFIEDCASRLRRYGVSEEEWASCVGNQLTGDAKWWYRSVAHYAMKWTDFLNAFRIRYTNTFSSLQARSRAVLQVQQRGESLTAFATRKMNLIRQHHPNMPTTEVLEVVASTVLPQHRGSIAPLIHSSYVEFMRSIMVIDGQASDDSARPSSSDSSVRRSNHSEATGGDSDKDTRQRASYPTSKGTVNPSDARNTQRTTKHEFRKPLDKTQPPPYPCRYCPGQQLYHWHSDCPNAPEQPPRRDNKPPPAGNGKQG